RRHRILKQLAKICGSDISPKATAIRIVPHFPDQKTRDRILQEGKVVVQLRKTDQMGLVSSSRCNTSLSCGRPVLAEPHDRKLSKPWDEIVTFTDTMEEFFYKALVMKAAWRNIHAAQFEKFKNRLTPELCIGEPLRKIGITSTAAAEAA